MLKLNQKKKLRKVTWEYKEIIIFLEFFKF